MEIYRDDAFGPSSSPADRLATNAAAAADRKENVAPAGTPPGCVSHAARRAGDAKKDAPLPRSVLGDVTHLFPGCGPVAGAGLAGGAGGAASAHAQASAAAARLRSMR